MAAPDDGKVSFTVKELLGRIEQKVDNLDLKLDAKAERLELMELINRVAHLETKNSVRTGIEGYKRWLWGGGILAAIAIIVNLIINLAQLGH